MDEEHIPGALSWREKRELIEMGRMGVYVLPPEAEERLKHLRRGEKLPVVKGRCRMCGGERPPGRRGYCSDGCQDAYLMATDSRYIRLRVFERDEGMCRGCGLDCDHLEVRLWGFSTMRKMPPRGATKKGMATSALKRAQFLGALKEFGFDLPSTVVTLWESDHVTPVVDGGSFLMENLQTLCLPCHAEKTAYEAKWRAKREKLLGRKWVETGRLIGRNRRKK